MSEPIKPTDVSKSVPDIVIDCFNKLIQERWSGSSARFKQSEVVALIVGAGIPERDIFDEGMLDVESLYRSAGWKVIYDKVAFSETYPATFTFLKEPTQ